MKKTNKLILLLIAIAIFAMILGCSDKKTDPKDPDDPIDPPNPPGETLRTITVTMTNPYGDYVGTVKHIKVEQTASVNGDFVQLVRFDGPVEIGHGETKTWSFDVAVAFEIISNMKWIIDTEGGETPPQTTHNESWNWKEGGVYELEYGGPGQLR